MKKLSSLFILFAAVTVSPLTRAQVTINDGDVFMGIRDSSKVLASGNAFVVDLGSMDQFVNALNGKTSINNFVSASSLQTDLNSFFGNNTWYNNANVVYGLFGGFQAGSSSSSIGTMPDNALIIGNTLNQQIGNLPDQTISGLTGYASSIGGNSQISSAATALSAAAWISSKGAAGAWDTYQYGGTATAANAQGAAAYGSWNYSLETSVSNPLYVNFVYDAGAGLNNGYLGTNAGTFTLAANGTTSYNLVPEPSTYAFMGIGALFVGFSILRRKKA